MLTLRKDENDNLDAYIEVLASHPSKKKGKGKSLLTGGCVCVCVGVRVKVCV